MKKLFTVLLLLFLLTITSCNNVSNDTIIIASPLGAPALATLDTAYEARFNDDSKYKFETLSNTTDVKAAFLSGTYDFMVAPVNIGAQIYNTNQSYKLVAGLTFGNLYFVSKSKIDSINDFTGKNIYLFGKNTINDNVTLSVLNKYNVEANINYNDSVNTNKTAFLADTSDAIYLLAEPVKSAISQTLKSKGIDVYSISVNNEFSENGFLQAGLFVKSNIKSEIVEEVVSDIKLSINNLNNTENISTTNNKIKELEYFDLSDDVMKEAIRGSNIDFISGDKLKNIFELTYKDSLSLLGGELPDEEFYYKI